MANFIIIEVDRYSIKDSVTNLIISDSPEQAAEQHIGEDWKEWIEGYEVGEDYLAWDGEEKSILIKKLN
jgi:hypothetical protein